MESTSFWFVGVNDSAVFASADAFSKLRQRRAWCSSSLNDPIVGRSQIITNAQTIVSREISPQDPGTNFW